VHPNGSEAGSGKNVTVAPGESLAIAARMPATVPVSTSTVAVSWTASTMGQAPGELTTFVAAKSGCWHPPSSVTARGPMSRVDFFRAVDMAIRPLP
jgi:hypothetical protein